MTCTDFCIIAQRFRHFFSSPFHQIHKAILLGRKSITSPKTVYVKISGVLSGKANTFIFVPDTKGNAFLLSLILCLYIIIISTHLKTVFLLRNKQVILETFIDLEWLKHTCFSTQRKWLSTCYMIIFIFIIYCGDHNKTHRYCMDKSKFPAKTFVSELFFFSFFFFGFCFAESSELSDGLYQQQTPLIERSLCNSPDWYDGEVTDNMICAGYAEGNRGFCQVSNQAQYYTAESRKK